MAATSAWHPSDVALRSSGLGELEAILAEAVAGHLEACDARGKRVAELSCDTFLGRLQGQASPTSPPPAAPSFSGLSKDDARRHASPGRSPVRTHRFRQKLGASAHLQVVSADFDGLSRDLRSVRP
ncbi:hypothetical protein OJF2_61860 [Aquisphaera giovannonii]|uniref:Uncharacterized protein n=1 Tax=Aquisphaera giovannonii TaxID=406548 RepID=A0A5B9WC29_9BACT|nr:hypothetical protein [Aquisphaera giovannonii]QEH37595.1 hypothetical protein OJF2_61860 [Aquisphaera giovannonii]